MSYLIDFFGEFKINNKLNNDHAIYLNNLYLFAGPHWSDKPKDLELSLDNPPKSTLHWQLSDNDQYLIPDYEDNFDNIEDHIEWLQYMISKFLIPWNYILNGEIGWRGEKFEDTGYIIVQNNVLKIKRAYFFEASLI
jgi:hypothetical protein